MKKKTTTKKKKANHVRDELWKFRALDANHLVHLSQIPDNLVYKDTELLSQAVAHGKIVVIPLAPFLDKIEDVLPNNPP